MNRLSIIALLVGLGLTLSMVWVALAAPPSEDGSPQPLTVGVRAPHPACEPPYSTPEQCCWIDPVTQQWACQMITHLPSTYGRIVFMSNRTGRWHLYVMTADGSQQTALTSDPNCDDSTPRVSPDLHHIVYRAQCGTIGGSLVVVNIDGTHPVTLTSGTSYDNSYPTWSPDGTQIAFASTRITANYNIYKMDANGANVTAVLTTTNKYSSQPAWSPNGQALAFVSNRDAVTTTTSDLYVAQLPAAQHPACQPPYSTPIECCWVDPTTQQWACTHLQPTITRLTTTSADNWYPAWSPDNWTIVFTSYRDGNGEIYTISAQGGTPTRLTNDPSDDWAATYSPDGLAIAFSSLRDGYQAVYAMNADGSSPTALTQSTGQQHNRYPVWILEQHSSWLPLILR